MADNNVIVGVFYGREQAQAAIKDLQEAGVRDIGYVERDDETTQALPVITEKENQEEHAQTSYLIVGAIVGIVLSLLAVLLIHGLLLLWWFLFALIGLFVGAFGGMLCNLLLTHTPSSDPKDAAYGATKAGVSTMLRCIVIVQADERAVDVYDILARHRPVNSMINAVARARIHDPEATIEMRTPDRKNLEGHDPLLG
jgi:hypothetical protein